MTVPSFRSQEEELRALSAEIAEAKAVLKQLAGTLQQLERHVARAFKTYAPVRAPTPRRLRGKSPETTIDPATALRLFDDLVSRARVSNDIASVRALLEPKETSELAVLSAELGVSQGRNPSRRQHIDGILGRVREAVMLGRNVNVSQANSPGSRDQHLS